MHRPSIKKSLVNPISMMRIFENFNFRRKSIGFCIPKMETPQPILPHSSGQNSLTERPQILGRALCCCCRITVSRESCRLGDVLTNKSCYAEAEVDLFTLNKVRPDICICPITVHIFPATYVDMLHWFSSHPQLQLHTCLLDVLWCQPIKLIHVVSTSEFREYWWNDIDFFFIPSIFCRASEASNIDSFKNFHT